MTITLPLPTKALRPNSRPHWTQRHRAVKAARHMAQVHTLAEGLQESGWTHYRITYHWPTPRRRWDDDNCIAACKAYLDGICAALGIDDRTLRLAGLEHVRDKTAGVEIELWNDHRWKYSHDSNRTNRPLAKHR